jgi:cyclopropane fatty-acyl-phospholipid synthase-like methyltransferase
METLNVKSKNEIDVVNQEAWNVLKRDLISTINKNVAKGKTKFDAILGIEVFFEKFKEQSFQVFFNLVSAPTKSAEQLVILESANNLAEFIFITVTMNLVRERIEGKGEEFLKGLL